MIKSNKIILAMILVLVCVFSFAACTRDNKIKLTMSELNYNEMTNTVNWDKVSNAIAYELKIDDGIYGTADITESGNKMQYVVNQSAGTHIIYVIAKGDGTNYSDSDVKSIQITIQSTGSLAQTLENTRLDLTNSRSVGLIKYKASLTPALTIYH